MTDKVLLLCEQSGNHHHDLIDALAHCHYQTTVVERSLDACRALKSSPFDLLMVVAHEQHDDDHMAQIHAALGDVPMLLLVRDEQHRSQADHWLAQNTNNRALLLLEHKPQALCRAVTHAIIHAKVRRLWPVLHAQKDQRDERIWNALKDHHNSRNVQWALLPPARKVHQCNFEHRFFPATELSGDFLDYVKISDSHMAFYLADVSGHGALSAYITLCVSEQFAALRQALVFQASKVLFNPVDVLQHIHSELMNASLGQYLTLFYGVLNTQTGHIHYSVAGHAPMPMLRCAKDVAYLHGKGTPIALFDDVHFESYECVMPEESELLLFSDGVFDTLEGIDIDHQTDYLQREFYDRSQDSVLWFEQHVQRQLERSGNLNDDASLLRIQRSAQ